LEPLVEQGESSTGGGTQQSQATNQAISSVQPTGEVPEQVSVDVSGTIQPEGVQVQQGTNPAAGVLVSAEALGAMAGEIKQIAAAVTMVASQCQENRSEMSELRAFVLAREKQNNERVSVPSVQNFVNDVQVPLPQRVATHASALMPGISPLLPTLTNLRSDAQLVNQAERLVDNMAGTLSGNSNVELSGLLKPGLLRQGGEQAPRVKTWWPHDFVMGYGEKSGLNYKDLDQVQWTLGYAAIVEQEPDPTIARLMLQHLQNLMQDAQFSGFETAKYAHGMILSHLERGRYTWRDVLMMSEVRRSVITAMGTQQRESPSASIFPQPRAGRQSSVQSSGGNNYNNFNSKSVKKLPKICAYFNNKVCSHKGDHETNGTFYVHACKVCYRDHTEKECGFL
jgi:hypothetical protein